jgi:hypothetical protein
MACSRCGDADHNVRTCDEPDESSSRYEYERKSDCIGGSECFYELFGNYCPECHRGD